MHSNTDIQEHTYTQINAYRDKHCTSSKFLKHTAYISTNGRRHMAEMPTLMSCNSECHSQISEFTFQSRNLTKMHGNKKSSYVLKSISK